MSQSQIAASEMTPFEGEEDIEFHEEEWKEAVSGSMIGQVSQTLAIFEIVAALLPADILPHLSAPRASYPPVHLE